MKRNKVRIKTVLREKRVVKRKKKKMFERAVASVWVIVWGCVKVCVKVCMFVYLYCMLSSIGSCGCAKVGERKRETCLANRGRLHFEKGKKKRDDC